MFEKQAVIDCLTNTAKYYDMPNADKWTKGIYYGLLHGLDNILDNVKPVDAIPRDQYESRLKADMVAMLTEIQMEIEEHEESIIGHYGKETKESDFPSHKIERNNGRKECVDLIQQKINELKG